MKIHSSLLHDFQKTQHIIPHMSDSHFHSAAMEKHGIPTNALLNSLAQQQCGFLLDAAINPEDDAARQKCTQDYPYLLRSTGLHPCESGRTDWKKALSLIEKQLSSHTFHAVGESGLDWARLYAPKQQQMDVFHAQLMLAAQYNLPIIIHNREAAADCWAMLKSSSLACGGILHCFSAAVEWIAPFLDLGMYISFAGNITFSTQLHEAVRRTPKNRLLIETDSPFLAPKPWRGKPNHPGMIGHTYQAVAKILNISPAQLCSITANNLKRLFTSQR